MAKNAAKKALRLVRRYAEGGTISDEDVPPPSSLFGFGAPKKPPMDEATTYPEWNFGNVAEAGQQPKVGPQSFDINPRPPEQKGIWERVKEGAKAGFGEHDLGFSTENRAAYPVANAFQPFVAPVDAAMRAIPGAIGGAGGVASGLYEKATDDSAGANRMQRDTHVLGQYPGGGALSAGVPHVPAGASAFARSKAIEGVGAVKEWATKEPLIPENSTGMGPAKLKQPPLPDITGMTFGEADKALQDHIDKYGVVKQRQPAPKTPPYDLAPELISDHFENIGPQKGSNVGGTYRNDIDGSEWYIKIPKTADHARNEKLASELYKLAGTPVADVHLTEMNGKVAVASPMLPGGALHQYHPAEYSYMKDLRDHFPADVWLANHDVVGLGKDNMIVMNDQVHRIDVGGALRYRAQGGVKNNWGPEVGEHKSMRDPNINADSNDVFGGASDVAFKASAARISKIPDEKIRELVQQYGPIERGQKAIDDLADTIIARKNSVADIFGAPPNFSIAAYEKGAASLMEKTGGNPQSLAEALFQIAKQHGGEVADGFANMLPMERLHEVGSHLDELVKRSGEDPWAHQKAPPPDDFAQKPWRDEHEPDGLGMPYEQEPYRKTEYTDADMAEYDAMQQESFEKDKAIASGASHGDLMMKNRPARIKHILENELKPVDWANYKPPHNDPIEPINLPPEAAKKAAEFKFNLNVALHKGFGHWDYSPEDLAHGQYPPTIMDPLVEKAGERALFFADDRSVAAGYGGGEKIATYMARAPKAFEVNWEKMWGAVGYGHGDMAAVIEAAHKAGADVVIIHNIYDITGRNSANNIHTQYAFLNTSVLRAPMAELNPDKLHLREPLAGLVGGGLFVYGTLKGQNDEGKEPEVQKKAGGGAVAGMTHPVRMKRGGMLNSTIPGRTDKIPVNVASGSYVLPADVPSALGEGNSMAGGAILKQMFTTGPLGMKPMKPGRPGTAGKFNWMQFPKQPRPHKAEGGEVEGDERVPIIAAGGEYIIHPEVVASLGGGSLTKGHQVLDRFVIDVRKNHIRTLRKLKPPKA